MKKDPKASENQLFRLKSYRECLVWLLESSGEKGQKTALARAMECQPAYLSRVLAGLADLSLEQIEAAARHFVLNPSESEFLIALLGEERAGTASLKAFWRKQKERILAERLELKNRVDLKMPLQEKDKLIYYSNWHISAVHVATNIEGLNTPEAIAKHLSLSPDLVRGDLDFLCLAGLVQNKNGRFVRGESQIHLDKDSPLAKGHHLNWKVKSMEAINQPKASDLHYSSVISVSRSDLNELKEHMLKAIEKIRKSVRESKDEIVACYSMELFELNRQMDTQGSMTERGAR